MNSILRKFLAFADSRRKSRAAICSKRAASTALVWMLAYIVMVYIIPILLLKNSISSRWVFHSLEQRHISRIELLYAYMVYVLIMSAGVTIITRRITRIK